MQRTDRRDFLRAAAAGVAAAGLVGAAGAADPKVQRRTLGSTGFEVGILGLGLGSQFVAGFKDKPEECLAVLERALEVHGINYWDTANGYGLSQQMIAPAVKKHREQIILVSKSGQRTYDGFKRELDKTLRETGTDHLQCFFMHDLKPADNLDAMETGCVKAAREARDQGVIQNYGFTGHTSAAVLCEAIRRFSPDLVLTVFPASGRGKDYETQLLPLAREKKIGVVAMKTVRQAQQAGLQGSDMPRYAMSLEGISTVIVGLDSVAHLDQNAQMAANFTPLNAAQMASLADRLRIATEGMTPPWQTPGYQDGRLV
ncbi:MAG: aldo/keto reductase [Fimbriimonadaceae bacterium]|nr:aldo/keto reductase [Fimbriimonadaceae bacterium]